MMKTMMLCTVVLVSGCAAFQVKDPLSNEQLAKVKNFQHCSSDLDCEDQHCGFRYVNTVAVCLDGVHNPRQ